TMVYEDRSAQWKSSIHYYLSKKFSQRHQVRIGWIGSQPGLDFDEVTLDSGSYRPLRSFQGRTYLSQTYVQWKYRITDVMVITPGLHWQHLTLNNNSSIEPRIGFRWQMNEKHTLSAGYGMHSQLQMYDIYFYETPVGPGKTVLTNKNLGFSKSHQWVVGHNFAFSRKLRLRTEIYLQKLYNIPVRNDGSGSFSVLNLGSEFNGLPDVDSLANNGKGTNYGLEITLERFFNKGFYYLGTLSLFRSEYVAADDIKRSSAYDGRYVINLLVGKEFNLGKHKVLSVDARVTRSGGKPYTPLDLQASLNAGGAVFDDSKAYTERFPDYFRTDLNLSFRINAKKVTHEWAFDVQNILNSKNILLLNYDSSTNQAFYEYQLGFFPVFQYRMMF
ncbi:MAG: TonB-dependent receptor, partial [Flavobacteriales bacterium]|nr:TonB-dependent receptor [Flavobacteriales bacterium]